MLGRCEKFTSRNAGAYAIKMSLAEISADYERNGINSPIVQAHYALTQLRKSPLVFEREWERMDYREIARSCGTLRKDFNNPKKWVK